MSAYNYKLDASYASSTDICPICKSTAQTTPNLRFKRSTKCNHRICEGCVDRKFTSGAVQCPMSGCNKQLWKRDWKFQTFEDIEVERQLEVTKSVYDALELSRLGIVADPKTGYESAFDDLKSYNDYLELRELLALNLALRTDVAATRKKLTEFENVNGLNSKAQTKNQLKDGEYPDASGLIKGLRKRYVPKALSPYKPFGDIPKDRDYYHIGKDDKFESVLSRNKKYEEYQQWGYSFEAYLDENLLRAFSGLGVFVDNEKGGRADMTLPANAVVG